MWKRERGRDLYSLQCGVFVVLVGEDICAPLFVSEDLPNGKCEMDHQSRLTQTKFSLSLNLNIKLSKINKKIDEVYSDSLPLLQTHEIPFHFSLFIPYSPLT